MNKATRAAVFLLWLLPLVLLFAAAAMGRLGPAPGDELINWFGHIALSGLLLTLSLSPLSQLPRLRSVKKLSRMSGLFVFFYAFLHGLAYLAFEVSFSVRYLLEDLMERPYIYVGVTALSILFVMALTSNRFSQKKLKRNWKRLHRLVYLALALILLHVLWIARSDLNEFVVYTAVAAFIVLCRFFIPRLSR